MSEAPKLAWPMRRAIVARPRGAPAADQHLTSRGWRTGGVTSHRRRL